MSSSLQNPFATRSQLTETSAQASPPSIALSSPPRLNAQSGPLSQSDLDSDDLEEPPPYTPSASITAGETTVELGPSRPFQTVPSSTNPSRNAVSQNRNQLRVPSSSSSPLQPSSRSTPSGRSTSIIQQLSDSFNDIMHDLGSSIDSLSHSSNFNQGTASQRLTGQPNMFSYPGQYQRPGPRPLSNPTIRDTHNLVPPPRHPLSPSASLHPPPSHPPPPSTSTHSLPSMTSHSSDFARDFYAAGADSGEVLVTEAAFAPPPGPPSSARPAPATQSVPNDVRPTSQPQAGHPLLKDGNLLVYPKGFECRKCHNVGYKDGKPQKPCNRCWKKYAKPFSGPLVYSFPADTASSSLASNFQKPLPSLSLPAASSSTSQPARLTRSNPRRHPGNHGLGGFHNPPTGFMPSPVPPPVPPPVVSPSSVTYYAGDPRIGGTLCWRCGGKGSVDMFLFDRETCSLCSGIGRVFR